MVDTARPAASIDSTAEHSQFRQILATLGELKESVDELRAQIAGRNKPFHSVAEFGELVERAAYTIRRWIKEGRITATRVSGTGPKGKLLIAHDQLDRILT